MPINEDICEQFNSLDNQITKLMKREILSEKDAIELCNTVYIFLYENI